MNENLNKKYTALAPEAENISLEELEKMLLGLKNELDEFRQRDDEAVTLRVVDGEEALKVEVVISHAEEKNSSLEDGFKGLDGEKAATGESFEFKIEDFSSKANSKENADTDGDTSSDGESKNGYIDDIDLFRAAARLVVEERVATMSFIQRQFGIGYAKAARIVNMLEELAIVSPMDGNIPRKVLVSPEKLEKILAAL